MGTATIFLCNVLGLGAKFRYDPKQPHDHTMPCNQVHKHHNFLGMLVHTLSWSARQRMLVQRSSVPGRANGRVQEEIGNHQCCEQNHSPPYPIFHGRRGSSHCTKLGTQTQQNSLLRCYSSFTGLSSTWKCSHGIFISSFLFNPF